MAAIGRLRISPSDLGRRVSVRHFDGSNLTDTLGILLSWTNDWPEGFIQVEKKDKSIQKIVTGNIFAAKVIEPEIGSLDLERDSETTWVASEKEFINDWVLRFSGNKSARANSCLLDGRPEENIDETFKKIIEWYRKRNAVAIIQSPKPGAFDESLKRNKFKEIDNAYYMIGDAEKNNVTGVILESTLSDKWFNAILNRDEEVSARISKELLLSGSFVRFASIENDQGQIIATGRISASDKQAMVTTLWVNEKYRNQGLAKKIMKALSNAVAEIGHKKIVLQVLKSNLVAVKMYESLGYEVHHEYAYYRYFKNLETTTECVC
jgi:GNAT superfamily N-acetyltransferase